MPRKDDARREDGDRADMPGTIARSDKHAREIWTAARDSAVKTYGEGGRAHRVAYAALKHQYEKKGDRWVKKAEPGPSDPQAARGPTTPIKSTDEPRAPTVRGKAARTEHEAERKAQKDARRSTHPWVALGPFKSLHALLLRDASPSCNQGGTFICQRVALSLGRTEHTS